LRRESTDDKHRREQVPEHHAFGDAADCQAIAVPGDREVITVYEISLWEMILYGTACIGLPLIGAGAVVAIAMPLQTAEQSESR
jgi:hypothetical protein